ncbi:hypothetical protein CDAR_373661 [Caerostris darwini]|uniref:Uncharacterized protein n=1 Tax=Caerostris darwini TaxID=1538125 RepID=A0AAV4QL16_9ARAC|nr:hypothetical protein CDAR_373661 [Caerostris darwini]
MYVPHENRVEALLYFISNIPPLNHDCGQSHNNLQVDPVLVHTSKPFSSYLYVTSALTKQSKASSLCLLGELRQRRMMAQEDGKRKRKKEEEQSSFFFLYGAKQRIGINWVSTQAPVETEKILLEIEPLVSLDGHSLFPP